MKKSWLNNKTILITGASGGIGEELSKELVLSYGAKVIGVARREERLIELKTMLKDNFDFFCYDITKDDFISKLNENLSQKNILIDVLISNAGIINNFTKTKNIQLQDAKKMFDVNYFPFLRLINNFQSQIESRKGGIVVTCSAAGISSVPGMSIYSATKHSIDATINAMRGEVKKGTYIGAIYPGFVKTELFEKKDNSKEIFDKKELKFIYKFAMSQQKAGKKIAKAISCKKQRYIMGVDSKALNFFGKIMPCLLPKIISKVFKASKLKTFDEIENNN